MNIISYKSRKLTKYIENQLFVMFKLPETKNDQYLQFERQVAHYTKPSVLFSFLKNEPSDFRLNVVDYYE